MGSDGVRWILMVCDNITLEAKVIIYIIQFLLEQLVEFTEFHGLLQSPREPNLILTIDYDDTAYFQKNLREQIKVLKVKGILYINTIYSKLLDQLTL